MIDKMSPISCDLHDEKIVFSFSGSTRVEESINSRAFNNYLHSHYQIENNNNSYNVLRIEGAQNTYAATVAILNEGWLKAS